MNANNSSNDGQSLTAKEPQSPISPKTLGIVTVTYSPGKHLGALLDSLPQAYAGNVHVVMADNGSSDGSPQAAADKYSCAQLLHTGGNIGYGGGMNAGVRLLKDLAAEGKIRDDFFLITNPDVVFTPGAIDEMLACMASWPKAGAVGPRIVEPDGSYYPSARALPNLSNGIGHALLANLWPQNPWTAAYRDDKDMTVRRAAGWLSGACMLVRWDAFDEVGGFDERYFMYMEDVDLCDRLGRAGYDNVFCPEANISHAQGHSTKAHAGVMLKAHHDSAYRFQADRHPRWWQWPIRSALRVGLFLRALVAVAKASKG